VQHSRVSPFDEAGNDNGSRKRNESDDNHRTDEELRAGARTVRRKATGNQEQDQVEGDYPINQVGASHRPDQGQYGAASQQ
jgi:hypothetical protein